MMFKQFAFALPVPVQSHQSQITAYEKVRARIKAFWRKSFYYSRHRKFSENEDGEPLLS
jgi:hypothetical protein